MHAAVLGRPIGHSLSPVLHRAAYAALGLVTWDYEAIDTGEDDLASILAASTDGWAGFSCTMPLKRIALELATEADPLAVAVGSANTLLPTADGWRAVCTDVAGIVASLDEHRVRPTTVTVLGAGGTAQAAFGALSQLGVGSAHVLVRDPRRVQQLTATAARLAVSIEIAPLVVDAAELDADLVISTLPAGAADGLARRVWRPGQAVLDVAYHPWPSLLAGAAALGGATVISGAAMLLHQAAEQVRLMTGHQPPVDAMRAALAAAVPGSGL